MQKKSFTDKFLHFVEKGGNLLPSPGTLFASFAFLILILSYFGSLLGLVVTHPATNEQVYVINLLSKEGIHRILLNLVDNYTGFAPLGIVMVAVLGIGVAEKSGLISAVIRLVVIKAPKSMITFVIVFAGISSNVASDLGYVLLIPLGGVIFHSLGRHPIAGLAAAFAGVSGGFSSNLFIGSIDPLLAGLSTEAARLLNPDYYVSATANYYFMFASTFVVSITGTLVTHKIIEPRLGKYTGNEKAEEIKSLSAIEKKGLKWVTVLGFVVLGIILWGLIPENGFFRGPDSSIIKSPLIKGVISMLLITSVVFGILFGFIVGNFKNDRDVLDSMNGTFKTIASFLVLVFFASQFVAFFRWSNLGLIFAIEGAFVLKELNLGFVPLIILFVAFSAVINLFMGSASAKWAILGPVFIPMFMLLGYSPELSQVVYRVGDSVTNIISPMMSFFALIITYFEKYDKSYGLGTIISTMLPYSIVFFIVWTAFLIAWIFLNIPLGPGVSVFY